MVRTPNGERKRVGWRHSGLTWKTGKEEKMLNVLRCLMIVGGGLASVAMGDGGSVLIGDGGSVI